MAQAIVNGRRIDLPNPATAADIRSAAGLRPGRRIIARKWGGSYPVKPNESISVQDGDAFVDAPSRDKGSH